MTQNYIFLSSNLYNLVSSTTLHRIVEHPYVVVVSPPQRLALEHRAVGAGFKALNHVEIYFLEEVAPLCCCNYIAISTVDKIKYPQSAKQEKLNFNTTCCIFRFNPTKCGVRKR
ncbi:Ribosome maturation protein SBDS isoform J [Glycine soja]|uniref:Ribosome maturation protein SBDS isoform B n=1 Tax=Glycine soja TaxID=3848 RepID=A0A445H6D8_GLYSO|nr:Ribosome maturation protein SBDS isoform B [Glycine soja]RZB69183.1 Ribosome maturation protein SBDS isoform J [Glycine soja]